MNPLIQNKATILPFLITGLICFVFTSMARAVFPPPDGGYPNFNTAEGTKALFSLTTGSANTAVGWLSLQSLTTGSYNTAIGAGTLLANNGVENTATGAGALLSTTTGSANTANGALALFSNSGGGSNTANGTLALFSNTEGDTNSAAGSRALYSNTTGSGNSAVGYLALQNNTTGGSNAAFGAAALGSLTSGSRNTALGSTAGFNLTTGNNNVCIGADVLGVAGESNTIRIGNSKAIGCYIAGIFGATVFNSGAIFVDPNGKLGTITSSIRFKDDIKPMEKASESLFALKPVSFRYKNEVDPQRIPHFGLVAEDVEKVNPDLIVRDQRGKPYSVRYDQVNAMLLNEFLKEHRKNEKQEATIARLQKQIEALAADLQEVRTQVQMSRVAANVTRSNH